jgi:phage tail-like protein
LARPRVLDYMQSNNFWLMDVDPNLNPPFFVFNPTMGFSQCSGVEIELQTEEYHPLHSPYPIHLPTKGRVGPVTLSRGARFFDTDFYRWIDRAIRGVDDFRRNILLIQMIGANAQTTEKFGLGGEFALQLLAGGGTSLALAGAASVLDVLPFKETVRVPGRAWILYDSIPVRYRAGELDASSADVTIMELEIQPRVVVEVALGSLF